MRKIFPLYQIPEVLEHAELLDDSILTPYNESIKSFGEKARKTLSGLNATNGELSYQNPYRLIQLQNANLLPLGARISTRNDLEKAISVNPNFLNDVSSEFGLALNQNGDP